MREKRFKRSLLWLVLVGGMLVLVSYAWSLSPSAENPSALWGNLPGWLLPVYQLNMLLAATGFFFFTWYLLRINPLASRWLHAQRLDLRELAYGLILVPSALWTPMTLLMLSQPGRVLWIGIRAVLALVALGSMALLLLLISMRSQWQGRGYWLAWMGLIPFLLQTVLLDALIWPLFFPYP